MNLFIAYSIIIFTIIIISFYIYILYVKIASKQELTKLKKYEKSWIPYIDGILYNMNELYPSKDTIEVIKRALDSKEEREITIERIVYFNSIFKGDIRKNITKFCEETGLVSFILARFNSKSDLTTAYNCKILGEIRSYTAITKLKTAFNRPSLDVKYNSLMAISKIGEVDAFIDCFLTIDKKLNLSERSLLEIIDSFEGNKSELYRRIIDSGNPFITTLFIKSLGNYKDVQFNDRISKFLKEDNKNLKIATIKLIGQTVDFRYFNDIIEALGDENWEVRAVAAKSLGNFQDERAINFLLKALSDSSWWVRYNAAEAIFNIPKALEKVNNVFDNNDSFAKDSLIYSMEVSGIFSELFFYEHSIDPSKRELAEKVKNYIIRSERSE